MKPATIISFRRIMLSGNRPWHGYKWFQVTTGLQAANSANDINLATSPIVSGQRGAESKSPTSEKTGTLYTKNLQAMEQNWPQNQLQIIHRQGHIEHHTFLMRNGIFGIHQQLTSKNWNFQKSIIGIRWAIQRALYQSVYTRCWIRFWGQPCPITYHQKTLIPLSQKIGHIGI